MRFLYHAFFARPDIPLLRLPWNALGVVAAGVAGFVFNDPNIWAVAGAGELIYLFTLASNGGFQQSILDREKEALRGDSEDARSELVSRTGGAARQRYKKLEEKRARLDQLYRDHGGDDLFIDSNREALQKLTWLFLNLLVAQRNLLIAPSTDEQELRQQIAACERDLAAADTESLRTSKEATLRMLRGRLDNVQHRHTSLAEIDADLGRIETQFDLALEEASLRGRPTAISSNIHFTSDLLSNLEDSPTTYGSDTTSSGGRELQ